MEVEIVNKLGLHARASAKLTQLAGSFPCEVWMERNNRRINAKSIMGVMMLAAGKGAKVIVDTDGERAEEALAALLDTDRRQVRGRRMSFALHGLAVSSGIAIGRAHLVSHATLEVAHYKVRGRDDTGGSGALRNGLGDGPHRTGSPAQRSLAARHARRSWRPSSISTP